jgi:GIGANTEA
LYVLQAEKDLQPWIARDDEQGQKMWRVNQRIVKLIAELMRNHDSPEALVILASASDLLLRATDGILIDGEACTLPQLEVTFSGHQIFNKSFSPPIMLLQSYMVSMLTIITSCECVQLLEVTARAVHLTIKWGDSGVAVADGLSNLLKACPLRLPFQLS